MNILIYPHLSFSIFDGGMIALYQLARLLHEAGMNAKIDSYKGMHENNIYNEYLHKNQRSEFLKNGVVVYCEAETGNPLQAKKVVRWMLSAPGRNVPLYANKWGKNDLVYYFNPEPSYYCLPNIFKLLTVFNIPAHYKDLKLKRYGTCYTIRKSKHQSYKDAFPPSKTSNIKIEPDWQIIDPMINHHLRDKNRYVDIFNRFKLFVSYDTMTFTSIIAALCGCVSVVNPCETMDKEQWWKKTCYWQYLKKKGLSDLHGIAYGMNDVQRAIDTIHLANAQINDMATFSNSEMINSFINDINKFVENEEASLLHNTVRNNFFRKDNRIALLNRLQRGANENT